MSTTGDGQGTRGYGHGLEADKPPEEMVLYEIVEPHIAKITLNRPERRNAILTPEMNIELDKKMEMAQDDDSVKVIILAANGSDFCAGEDNRRMPVESFGLKKGQRLPQSLRMRGMRKVLDVTHKGFTWGDKWIVAACQGGIIGQGFSFTMTCDLIICSDDAYFARRQSRIGFAGFETQLPLTLARLGMNRGMEFLITGRTAKAQEFKEWGVVSSIVPRERLMDEALRYAKAIAAHSTDNLMLGKRAFQQYLHLTGMGAYMNFASVAHPLFTNMVWREDEHNWLRDRNEYGNKEAMNRLNKVWEDLGFG